jgi:hypothetical protein
MWPSDAIVSVLTRGQCTAREVEREEGMQLLVWASSTADERRFPSRSHGLERRSRCRSRLLHRAPLARIARTGAAFVTSERDEEEAPSERIEATLDVVAERRR